MQIVHRRPLKRDYISLPTYIVDTSATSPEYFNIQFIPDYFTAGKTIIRFKGNGLNFRQGAEIDAEVIGPDGQPIFSQFSKLIDKNNDYYLTITIYDDVPRGIGTITFVGEAAFDQRGNPVPESEKGKYNVKWSRNIEMIPNDRNKSELIFDTPPDIFVEQVTLPFRIQGIYTASSGIVFLTTSSAAINITTSDNKGFDFERGTNNQIKDVRSRGISVDPDNRAVTENSVDTTLRLVDDDISGGFRLTETTRFNTVAVSTNNFFRKQYLGGYFEFLNTGSTPQVYLPTLPTGVSLASASYTESFSNYKATIVEVLNSSTVVLDKPLEISVTNSNGRQTITTPYTIKYASDFTASIAYLPTDLTFVTGSTSQSYIQFTFLDLDPIAGQVYRIKSYYKTAGRTGDYTILNDQYIKPVEYLVDATYPNQTGYARGESDFLLYGHFTTQSILDSYWSSYIDVQSGYDYTSSIFTNNPQIESAQLTAIYTRSCLLAPEFNEFYAANQRYSISFYTTLDPDTELYVYMNNNALIPTVIEPQGLPTAFNKSTNPDKTKYPGSLDQVGKMIGWIKNTSGERKRYGKVVFDFAADGDGLARPIFVAQMNNSVTTTGSVYIGEVSIKPLTLNGFTPSIVQFAVPTPPEYEAVLSQSVDFKIEYLDYTGNQSEYITYINNVPLNLTTTIPTNTCQDDNLNFKDGVSLSSVKVTDTFQKAAFNMVYKPYITTSMSDPNWWLQNYYLPITTEQAGKRAIPFTSYANDYLWNIAIPQWTSNTTYSFCFSSSYYADSSSFGIPNYNIMTSSWVTWDPKLETFNLDTHVNRGYRVNYPTGDLGYDNRYFAHIGGAAISKTAVSASLVLQNDNISIASLTGRNNVTTALKQRRLYFPVPQCVDTWLQRDYGVTSSSLFDDNGGLYNVKFRLKRTGSYNPDTGSFMTVFISDVHSRVLLPSDRVIGSEGWYPPAINMITIGNGYETTPLISFYDEPSGTYIEEYDIYLIQYGSNAQLCFEASGSLTNDSYFGIVVDGVKFCKVGVITDPKYLKPETTADKITSAYAKKGVTTPQNPIE